jgi:hypothetical protein
MDRVRLGELLGISHLVFLALFNLFPKSQKRGVIIIIIIIITAFFHVARGLLGYFLWRRAVILATKLFNIESS